MRSDTKPLVMLLLSAVASARLIPRKGVPAELWERQSPAACDSPEGCDDTSVDSVAAPYYVCGTQLCVDLSSDTCTVSQVHQCTKSHSLNIFTDHRGLRGSR